MKIIRIETCNDNEHPCPYYRNLRPLGLVCHYNDDHNITRNEFVLDGPDPIPDWCPLENE